MSSRTQSTQKTLTLPATNARSPKSRNTLTLLAQLKRKLHPKNRKRILIRQWNPSTPKNVSQSMPLNTIWKSVPTAPAMTRWKSNITTASTMIPSAWDLIAPQLVRFNLREPSQTVSVRSLESRPSSTLSLKTKRVLSILVTLFTLPAEELWLPPPWLWPFTQRSSDQTSNVKSKSYRFIRNEVINSILIYGIITAIYWF